MLMALGLYIKIENIDYVKERVIILMSHIGKWMKNCELKLNDNKTEIIILG